MHRPSSYSVRYSNTSSVAKDASTSLAANDVLERIVRMIRANAVVIFSRSQCCLCYTVKRLLSGMGVNSMVYELDEYPRGLEMESALMKLLGESSAVPVVFVGGKLIGGIESVIGSHIDGTLVPCLKEAGALWL